jgi:hypothetical protein
MMPSDDTKSCEKENKQQQQQALVVHSTKQLRQKTAEEWVDSVVDVASHMRKMFTKSTCRLCQVYVDNQVEFEQQQRDENFCYQKQPHGIEVELYRQFMFDEESVVECVSERNDVDEEKEQRTSQRTQ